MFLGVGQLAVDPSGNPGQHAKWLPVAHASVAPGLTFTDCSSDWRQCGYKARYAGERDGRNPFPQLFERVAQRQPLAVEHAYACLPLLGHDPRKPQESKDARTMPLGSFHHTGQDRSATRRSPRPRSASHPLATLSVLAGSGPGF